MLTSFFKRWRVPKDFPYYEEWFGSVKTTAHDHERQLLQMYGTIPETGDAEALLREHPEFDTNMLLAYKHVYDNGNPAAATPEKKIIFLHLQRTAGSTLTHVMRRNLRSIGFRRDFVGMPNESPMFVLSRFRELSPAQKEAERDKWDRYDALADHSIYGIHELLRSPHAYITMLRHPVDRLLSYYRYVRRENPNASPREAEEAAVARTLSITQFLHHPFFRLKLTLEQSYVQMIAGYAHPGGYVFHSRLHRLLAQAVRNLKTFDAVLLQEHFDRSMELLCRKYDWKDELMTNEGIVPRRGSVVGDVTGSTNAKSQLTHAEYETVAEYLKADMTLYEHGKRMFEEQYKRHCGSGPYWSLRLPLRGESAVEAPMDTEEFPTSVGPVHIGLPWARLARTRGIHPLTIDDAARYAYYTRNLRRDAFLDAACNNVGEEHRDLVRLWLLTLHAEHVCGNVIEQDAYGLRSLKENGFMPKIIVDVGAHVGAFSLFARHLWPHARIIAAEPCAPDKNDSGDIAVLRQNVADADIRNVAVFGMVTGDAKWTGRAELLKDTVPHSMELGCREYPLTQCDTEACGLRAVSISELLPRESTIDLLKLSCDGAETNILRELSMTGALARIREIRGEWHGDMGKSIPALLASTHDVRTTSIAPAHARGTFFASLKPDAARTAQPFVPPPMPHFTTPARTEAERSSPVPMVRYRTSMGPLFVHGDWADTARTHGIEPDAVDAEARRLYYKEGLREPVLGERLGRKFGLSQTIGTQWMHMVHARHICMQVIDKDCYRLRRLTTAPATIVDIGGHIGTFSLHAHALWPHARIVAVEPVYRALLGANTEETNVEIVPTAVIGLLHDPRNAELLDELRRDSFSHEVERGLRGDPACAEFTATMSAMDAATLVRDKKLTRIDLLKLDCEGAEINILRELHAMGMLADIGTIVGEWHGAVSRRTVEELLRNSHGLEMVPTGDGLGLFFASRLK